MTIDFMVAVVAALGGYLIGSISFARVLGRWLAPGEITGKTAITWGEEGEGFVVDNVSATTIAQRRGPRYGCLTAILDILKATIPVLILSRLYPEQPYAVIYAVTVLLGHNFPLYYGFKGGRGTSVMLGSLLVLDPLSIPVTITLGYLIGLFIFKDVLLAHHAGWMVLLPFWFAATGQWDLVIYALCINILRWSVSVPEIKTYLTYRRTGELRTQAFHEAIEQTHMGYIHKQFRQRGWLKYPYMEEPPT